MIWTTLLRYEGGRWDLALTLEAPRLILYFFLDYKRSCRAPYKSLKLTNLPNLANLFLKEINRLINQNKYLNRTRTLVLGPASDLAPKNLSITGTFCLYHIGLCLGWLRRKDCRNHRVRELRWFVVTESPL